MKEFVMFIGVLAIVIGVIFVSLILLVVFSCCAISSRCSRREENELSHRISDLSDLEKETVENIVSGLSK